MWRRVLDGAGLNVVFSAYIDSEIVFTRSEYHRPAESNSENRSGDAPRSWHERL